MQSSTTTVTAADGTPITVHQWSPDAAAPVRGVLVIAHGMAEHAARYAPAAEALTASGYAVWADDHRGHGETAGGDANLGHLADHDGWSVATDDLIAVVRAARAAHPGVPVHLLGHSMGSSLARTVAIRYGAELDSLVLSGPSADPGLLGKAGLAVARAEKRLRGARARSPLMDKLTFGEFNRPFKPNRTAYDWLSRDEAQVDAYVNDPWCGVVSTTSFFVDLIGGVQLINDPAQVLRVPKTLPIRVMAGSEDPVGGRSAVQKVADLYRRSGVAEVETRVYEGGRHEIFNETDRDQVVAELISWLDAHTP